MPVTFDGDTIGDITIDGSNVSEITMDGDLVWTAGGGSTSTQVIEDWESSDPLSKWNGETGECNITTSVVSTGEKAVSLGGQWLTTIYANSGDLNTVPAQGDRFRYYVRHESTGSQCDGFLEFARQDGDNFYTIYTDANANNFRIRKTKGGSVSTLKETSFDFSAERWYKVEVDWDDGNTFGGSAGDITARIYRTESDFVEITANDPDWTSGDVQIRADKGSNGNRVWFDGWKVVSNDESTAATSHETGNHLDMTAAPSDVDVSTHGITVSPGQSFLTWVQPTQLGSSGDPKYPGVFASSTSSFDNYFSLHNDDGTTDTTGTVNVNLTAESADGHFASSEAFTYDLDEGLWILVGFTYHSDESITWFHNDSELPARQTHDNTGTQFDVARIGYGYGGATDAGSGGKFMDSPMVIDEEVTVSQVSELYHYGVYPASRQNHWKFDDTGTADAIDSIGTADGTINGATYLSGNAPRLVIDGWESGSIGSAWTDDTGTYTVAANTSLKGDYLLADTTNFDRLWGYEGDGHEEYYHRHNDEALVYYTMTDTADAHTMGMYFGVVDANNNYFVRHFNGNYQIVRKVSGSNTTLDGTAGSVPANTVLRWEIRWDDGTNGDGSGNVGDMRLDVYNDETGDRISTVTTNSTDVESNTGTVGAGIGIWSDESAQTYHDLVYKKPW